LELTVKINPQIKDTIALWDQEAIVYHPFSGITNHLDALATAILSSVIDECLSLTQIENLIKDNQAINSSFELSFDLIHAYAHELISSEILIKC
jgi:hypothetical protein